MTPEEENELNKKLVEKLLGFEVTAIFSPDGFTPKGRICFYTNEMVEDGFGDKEREYEVSDLFTRSLDACIDWLVPELRDISVNYPSVVHDKPTFLVSTWKNGVSYLGYNEKPALALSLAIEKLADSEAKK